MERFDLFKILKMLASYLQFFFQFQPRAESYIDSVSNSNMKNNKS